MSERAPADLYRELDRVIPGLSGEARIEAYRRAFDLLPEGDQARLREEFLGLISEAEGLASARGLRGPFGGEGIGAALGAPGMRE